MAEQLLEVEESKDQRIEVDQMIVTFSIFKLSNSLSDEYEVIIEDFEIVLVEELDYVLTQTHQQREEHKHFSKWDEDGYEYRLVIAKEKHLDHFASDEFDYKEVEVCYVQLSIISPSGMELNGVHHLFDRGLEEAVRIRLEFGDLDTEAIAQIIDNKIFTKITMFNPVDPETRVEIDTLEVFGLEYIVPYFWGILLKPNKMTVEEIVQNQQDRIQDFTHKLLGDPFLFSEQLSGGIFHRGSLLLHRESEHYSDKREQIKTKYLLISMNHGEQSIEQSIYDSYDILRNDEKNIYEISNHFKLNDAFFNKFQLLSIIIASSNKIVLNMEKRVWSEKLSNILLRQQILAHKMQMQLQELFMDIRYVQRKYEQDQKVIMSNWTRPFSIGAIDRLNPMSKAKVLISEKIKQRLDQIYLTFEFKNQKINNLYSYVDIMIAKRKEQEALKSEEKTKRLNQLLLFITFLTVFPILMGQMGISDHLAVLNTFFPNLKDIMKPYFFTMFQVFFTLVFIIYLFSGQSNAVIRKVMKKNYLEESDKLKEFMDASRKLRFEIEENKGQEIASKIANLEKLFRELREEQKKPHLFPKPVQAGFKKWFNQKETEVYPIDSLIHMNEKLEALYELYIARSEMEAKWKSTGDIELQEGINKIYDFIEEVTSNEEIAEILKAKNIVASFEVE
ncbi:hypothetical protein [Ammoniphilus sp. CFH 90114]|uniref:hypothetical protein n=1 Tax=Ammoniphilus sp. CFH 90114 TaxID=2493665 RepID=UPI00100E6F36|nr:hypothetical protein [Ammoniphilus sp. CFH 90114]RXT02748.1 hypothetical protein EIZ39_24440 [Ammoniphilus sp. CFH 90114]